MNSFYWMDGFTWITVDRIRLIGLYYLSKTLTTFSFYLLVFHINTYGN